MDFLKINTLYIELTHACKTKEKKQIDIGISWVYKVAIHRLQRCNK